MKSTIILINLIAVIGLLLSLRYDRAKTKVAMKIAVKSLVRLLPMLMVIVLIIGWLMALVPPAAIDAFIGEKSGAGSVVVVALFGSALHIPSIISFPLAASILQRGASIAAVAAFITSLTMIGMVTLPLEINELGKTLALLRNGLSFLFAIIIAFIIGALL